ncbi:MAG: hypothetical protein AAF399_04260 [Bacteroidota bacterium]
MTAPSRLVWMSIGWLLLPNLIFLLGWLTPWLSVPLVVGLLWIWGKKQEFRTKEPSGKDQGKWWLLGFALVWTWLSGIGGFAWQRADYLKHDLVWHDLLQQDWPIVYEQGEMLVYYLGYYLVSGGLAKLLGSGLLPWATMIWSGLGMWLAARWWQYHSELRWGWVVLGMSVFAGLDGVQIATAASYEWLSLGQLSWIRIAPIEGHLPAVWGLGHRIPANFSQLAWTPQHAIAGWVCTGVLWAGVREGNNLSHIGWVWALLWIHSPMVAIGTTPLLLMPVLQGKFRELLRWEHLLIGGALLGIMLAYFGSHAPLSEKGWIWETATVGHWWWLVPLFWFWEVGLLIGLLWKLRPSTRNWLLLGGGFIALLCVFRLGYYHDLLMRASLPMMMILGIISLQALSESVQEKFRAPFQKALLLFWLIGAAAPVQEQVKSLIYTVRGQTDFRMKQIPADWDMRNVDDCYQQQDIPHPFELAPQYLGNEESFWGRYLMRRP